MVYSLIRLRDGFKAREYFLRIQENEMNFSEVATKFSEGDERFTKGIVGPVAVGSAHPKLANVLKASQPGELKQPFKIDNLFIIVKLESMQEATLDDEMRVTLCREILEEWIDEETRRNLASIIGSSNEQEAQGQST